jgi:hypothetical protein
MSNADREALYFNIEWYAAQIGKAKLVRPIHEYTDSELVYMENFLKNMGRGEPGLSWGQEGYTG